MDLGADSSSSRGEVIARRGEIDDANDDDI